LQVESLSTEKKGEVINLVESLGYQKLFSLRDDHLFLSSGLQKHAKAVLEEISNAVSRDLLFLMHLRREKRSIARAAQQLRTLAGYTKDPLFMPADSNPFK